MQMQTTRRPGLLADRARNEWNLTDPATEPRTLAEYVADYVAAFQCDPADTVTVDLFAQIGR